MYVFFGASDFWDRGCSSVARHLPQIHNTWVQSPVLPVNNKEKSHCVGLHAFSSFYGIYGLPPDCCNYFRVKEKKENQSKTETKHLWKGLGAWKVRIQEILETNYSFKRELSPWPISGLICVEHGRLHHDLAYHVYRRCNTAHKSASKQCWHIKRMLYVLKCLKIFLTCLIFINFAFSKENCNISHFLNFIF